MDNPETPPKSEQPNVWPLFSWRYWRLVIFFSGSFLHLWFLDYFLTRILGFEFPKDSASRRHRRLASDFRELATKMGGVLIKLGQFLSSRVDVMPPEVIEELSGLQDKVEPVPYPAIKEQFQSNFGKNPEEMFTYFESEPEASASLGQVHLAGKIADDPHHLRNGNETAVKVQRPNIKEIIETDLAAVKWLVGWLKYIGFIRRRADLDSLYDEFSNILRGELNYKQEAKNAEIFSDYVSEDSGVDSPSPYWDVTTSEILVLDRIEGIKITEYDQLEAAGISRTEVAKRALNSYLQQIYVNGFFHGDPHPGNIFVQPDPSAPAVEEGKRFKLIFVDFGMVGEISSENRSNLRQFLIAMINKDYQRMVDLAKELGFLLPEADDEKVIDALETLFDRFYGVTLGELASVDMDEIEELISEFRDLLFEFPFQVPQEFILLGRCMGILNGLTTGLDPDYRPVEEIEAFAQDLIEKEGTWAMGSMGRNVMEWMYILSKIPRQASNLLQKFEPPIEVSVDQDEELKEKMGEVENAINRLTETLVSLSAAGGGIVALEYYVLLAYFLWGFSGIFLLSSWLYRARS
ncbi:MAG: ABC1 kinase family protein [bacterium]